MASQNTVSGLGLRSIVIRLPVDDDFHVARCSVLGLSLREASKHQIVK